MTLPQPALALITARRLEQVPPDRPGALARLARAEEKLEAAKKIEAIDVDVAYVTTYDAARIAVIDTNGNCYPGPFPVPDAGIRRAGFNAGAVPVSVRRNHLPVAQPKRFGHEAPARSST